MIEIGKYNRLEVFRHTPQGTYLMDEEGYEVLLPQKYVPDGIEIDAELEVFVYNDSEDRLVATTQTPKIKLHEFAYLEVVQVNKFGAFLDWGLDKDLLVPFAEQSRKMITKQWYLVYLYLDEETERLVASSKLKQFLDQEHLTVAVGEEVDLIVAKETDLGYNVIINNLHRGLIFSNEIFQSVQIGDRLKGYIKNIREDNKIDVSLQKQGFGNIEPNADKILTALQENKGFLPLHDKSKPEAIMLRLEMSKKTFKKAIGGLYKQRLIRIGEEGIYLVEGAQKK